MLYQTSSKGTSPESASRLHHRPDFHHTAYSITISIKLISKKFLKLRTEDVNRPKSEIAKAYWNHILVTMLEQRVGYSINYQ